MPQPERLGPFVLVERLGAGAMGTVWRARDDEEGRDVALKVFPPELSRREGFLARFQRETDAGKRIDDPHVVRTYGAEMQLVDGEPCCVLVLEYVGGRTLRELLGDLGQVPEGLAREIARQVASGLAAIHAAGFVHRDLNPENVLVTPQNVVRIADLGIAKVLDATVALTQEGQFAGSLVYASPEQIHGRDVGPASDLYSLGVVLHELLTAANPFVRETAAEVMHAHLEADVADVSQAAPDTSPFLCEVVRALLERSPARRIESAAALVGVLTEGESSSWWRSRADDVARRRSSVPRIPVRRESALHGREDDLALLGSAWNRARSGAGNTVLFLGEAGIGKSRLVDAFFGTLAGTECHAVYGSFPPVGGRGAISDALVAALGADDLPAKLAAHLRETPLLAPPLAAWLRHEPPPEGAVSLQGDALHAALVHVMRSLARERPLVWVVEDLHFADEDHRKLALSLARAVEGHRVLLVLTSRPGLPDAELTKLDRLDNLRRTSLERLGAREVILLLQDAFRSERLAEKLGAKVALASDGNPFFVFEMIRGLKQGQFVTELPDGTWVDTKAIDQIPVPPAVKDLVAARLEGLTQAHREILDAGAAQGFEFDASLVAEVLRRDRFEVLRDLAQIERTSGVVRSSGRLHRFDHHQIQEFLYDDLSHPLREEFHAASADAIERREGATSKDPATLDGDVAVALADHFLRGAQGRRAVRYLVAALTHLGKGYLNEQSVALAERAFAVPGLLVGVERADLLLGVFRGPLDRLGRRVRQEAVAREMESIAEAEGDASLRCRAASMLGGLFYVTSRASEAEAAYGRSLELARSLGDRRNEATALGGLGTVLLAQCRLSEAQQHFDQSIAISRETGDRRGESSVLGNLGIALWYEGRFASAREHFERGLALSRELGDRNSEASATGNLGNVLFSLGDTLQALACFEQHHAMSREQGDRRDEAVAIGNVGAAFGALGRLGKERECLERALSLRREIGDRQGEVLALQMLAGSLVETGECGCGKQRWLASLALAIEIGDRLGVVHARLALGALHRDAGEETAARRLLTRSRDESSTLGYVGVATLSRCHLARLPGGDVDDAEHAFAANVEHLDAHERLEARWLLWKASGESTHLVEAKRLLDESVAQMSAEDRVSALANLRLNREIAAAAAESGL